MLITAYTAEYLLDNDVCRNCVRHWFDPCDLCSSHCVGCPDNPDGFRLDDDSCRYHELLTISERLIIPDSWKEV